MSTESAEKTIAATVDRVVQSIEQIINLHGNAASESLLMAARLEAINSILYFLYAGITIAIGVVLLKLAIRWDTSACTRRKGLASTFGPCSLILIGIGVVATVLTLPSVTAVYGAFHPEIWLAAKLLP